MNAAFVLCVPAFVKAPYFVIYYDNGVSFRMLGQILVMTAMLAVIDVRRHPL